MTQSGHLVASFAFPVCNISAVYFEERGSNQGCQKLSNKAHDMKRREFVAAVLGAISWPAFAQAQPPKVPRVGVLWHAGSAQEEAIYLSAFERGLGELGYVEGRTILLEHRFPNEEPERFASMAAELVAHKVDVLVTASRPAAVAAHRATTSIPIVFIVVPDPVEIKLVESLGRPGGNITGLTNMAVELSAKRLALFKDALPRLRRVALLVNANDDLGMNRYVEETRDAGAVLGVEIQPVGIRTVGDMEGAFDQVVGTGCDGVVTVADGLIYQGRVAAAQAALSRRLPLMMVTREMLQAGSLMTYGPDHQDIFRRAAGYVDKIIKGERPSELPVEQPTKFQFLINLKTAKALSLDIAPTLLARADEVLE
jgi:putative ABC transport system substrate-binding protein